MRFLRNRNEGLSNLLEELRCLEDDAARACRLALEAMPDEPLTRGQLFSFLSEYEAHRAELAGMLSKLPRPRKAPPSGLSDHLGGRSGSIAILRVIRRNAEVGVRRYQQALANASEELAPMVRSHTNAWLRHRAWLTARIDAFARTRESHPPH